MPEPAAAASLILMRDRRGASPELLIVQRSTALVFAGGAYVFPGGRVEAVDAELALRFCPDLDPEDGAARIAAIRETIEETGIAAAVMPHPDLATIAAWRSGSLDMPAGDAKFCIDVEKLVPFARWLPNNETPKRRFDTRFYVASLEDAEITAGHDPEADGTESSHAFWASAEEVLARCRAGNGRAIFPTRRLLERLARFANFEEARAEALRLPQRIITPWIEQRSTGSWLCIPGDAGYPVCEESLDTAARY